MLRRALFLLALLAAYIWAANPWRMPTGGWSQSDLERLLNRSPWAVETEATMDDPSDREEPAPVGPPAGSGQPALGGHSSSGPNGMRWDGGIGKNRRGHLATIPVAVRWNSANVIRQALAQTNLAGMAELNAAAADNFIISVSGLLPAKLAAPPATSQTKSSSEDTVRAKSADEILEWFMNNSRLLIKGDAALQPQNVKVDPATGALILFFKRTDAFKTHKRDVLFVTRFGTMNVQTRFRTRDMLVDGQPDL